MCGIIGCSAYVEKCNMKDILLNGLKRLEYRGYDSAGIAIGDESNQKYLFKSVGKVKDLESKVKKSNINWETLESSVGIAHTRWATHGPPSVENAHPQISDPNMEFLVVHNGIISNYLDLKNELISKGVEFECATDTECIPKLAYYYYHKEKPANFVELIKKVCARLEGNFAILCISSHYPGEMISAKNGSPMILGINIGDSEISIEENAGKNFKPNTGAVYYAASDISAFLQHTNKVYYMKDGDIIHFINGNADIYNLDGSLPEINITTINIDLGSIMKEEFPHFMLKEISEQPVAIKQTLSGRLDAKTGLVNIPDLDQFKKKLCQFRRLEIIACGTSYHSALAARLMLEELSGLLVEVVCASDFNDRLPLIDKDTLYIFISQSGETADSLACLSHCKKNEGFTMGITNVVGSTISRQTNCGFHLNAGPEISVASTKAYTCQFASLALFSIYLSYGRKDTIDLFEKRASIVKGLINLDNIISQLVKNGDIYKKWAETMTEKRELITISRGFQYATCIEASLKIKELVYIHAEGISAGELKHGPIALVDENLSLLFILTRDRFFEKTYSSYQQVCARKGRPIVICFEEDRDKFDQQNIITVPDLKCEYLQGIVNIVPLQLFAYYLACSKGYDVDFPRNLAKSVTVE